MTRYHQLRVAFVVLLAFLLVSLEAVGGEPPNSESANAIPCFGFTGSIPIRISAGSEIRYVVPGNGLTVLSVLDIEGHTVARLVEGVDLTGAQTARWSGLDRVGKPLSSGVYFIRLEAGEYSDIRKIVVIQ